MGIFNDLLVFFIFILSKEKSVCVFFSIDYKQLSFIIIVNKVISVHVSNDFFIITYNYIVRLKSFYFSLTSLSITCFVGRSVKTIFGVRSPW